MMQGEIDVDCDASNRDVDGVFMQQALEQARIALAEGEVPVG